MRIAFKNGALRPNSEVKTKVDREIEEFKILIISEHNRKIERLRKKEHKLPNHRFSTN